MQEGTRATTDVLKLKSVGQPKKFTLRSVFGQEHPELEILDGFDTPHPVTAGFKLNPYHAYIKEPAKVLGACFLKRIPVVLVGKKGCGKSSGVINMLLALNLPFLKVDGSKYHDKASLFGRLELAPTGGMHFVDGPVTTCMRNGWSFVYDEMFKATDEALVCLNTVSEGRPVLLEENGNEVVAPAPGFWLVGTSNSNGSGAGRAGYGTEKKQDRSLLDRVALIQCHYLAEDKEIEVLKKTVPGLHDETYKLLVKFAGDTRAAVDAPDDKRIEDPLSTRGLIMALTLSDLLSDVRPALDAAYFSKLSETDRTVAEVLWNSQKGTS